MRDGQERVVKENRKLDDGFCVGRICSIKSKEGMKWPVGRWGRKRRLDMLEFFRVNLHINTYYMYSARDTQEPKRDDEMVTRKAVPTSGWHHALCAGLDSCMRLVAEVWDTFQIVSTECHTICYG
ncbi:hypothetical protein L1887_24215 [Cichorium endivia]|nr:hypothetical protein L1887_24215 [Cichorium endivia]